MKKLLLIIVFSMSFLAFAKITQAQDSGWQIDSFNSDINLLASGKVDVEETISVNFNNLYKHGIYRDLIYKKDSIDQKKHYLSYEISGVRLDNSSVQYETSYESDFFRIKIGDPSRTITGIHVYKIVYQAVGTLGSFSDHDEFYWNVTGNYWTIPILASKAIVTLPKGEISQITCYEGIIGSRTQCQSFKDNTTSATFASTQELNSGEGLTTVVGFAKGLVPILEGNAPPFLNIDPIDLGIFGIIVFSTFLVMFYLWWKKGRDHWFKRRFMGDPNTKDELEPLGGFDTIVVEYDPPEKLRPAEMSLILNENVSTTAITATIIDLAVRGYLKINETEKGFLLKAKDYELIKENNDYSGLMYFETELLNRLFKNIDTVSISSLKTEFYKDLIVIKESLNQGVTDKKFFIENPTKAKGKYLGIGAIILVSSILSILFNFSNVFQHEIAFVIAGIVSGGIITLIGYFMSARTALGHEMKNRILGYKLFISTAEKYRQQFFERQNMFNEILPYAIVFEQTEKFAKAFASLGVEPPETNWYVGAAAFSASTFSNDMTAFASSFGSSMSSSSGMSGGGGSGGGGGGGGGGGW